MPWRQTLHAAVILCTAFLQYSHAQIYRWDNGQVIPGTEQVTPGPGVMLDSWNSDSHQLRFADLAHIDLTRASFTGSWLDNASLLGSNLTQAMLGSASLSSANLSGADLSGAFLYNSAVSNANFAGTRLRGANLAAMTGKGFTAAQLASSESYQQHDLSGISFWQNDLSGWNFSGQDLRSASFHEARLAGADLTEAQIGAANLGYTTQGGFTADQLYSTASYRSGDLSGVVLEHNDMNGWNLAGQNLSRASVYFAKLRNASLVDANLTGAMLDYADLAAADLRRAKLMSGSIAAADLTGANLHGADLSGAYLGNATLRSADLTGTWIGGANLSGTTAQGLAPNQFYTTASYGIHDLASLKLNDNDLTNWSFTGQNLSSSSLRNATLTSADFRDAVILGTDLTGTTAKGFRWEQLAATASYRNLDMRGIVLSQNDLQGWDLHGQNLAGGACEDSNLTRANFRGADLSTGVLFRAALSEADLSYANLSQSVLYGTNLTSAKLAGANLSGANLGNASVRSASLRDANLTNGIFSGAKFVGADLTGADLRGAIDWNAAGADMTNAIWPDGRIEGLTIDGPYGLVVRDYDGDSRPYFPPHGPIPIHVKDHMLVTPDGWLRMELGEDAWDSTISFDPAISVQIEGNLVLAFAPGVAVADQIGRTFKLFDWKGVQPSVDLSLASPYVWDSSRLDSDGEVRLIAVPEPGGLSGCAAGCLVWLASTARRARRAADTLTRVSL